MALTDKQYSAIERYVEGEMDVSEKEAFEAALLQNSELAEEVEVYKEILSLTDSIEQKMSEAAQPPSKNSSSKEVWELLERERRHWEQHHEPELKRLHGLAASDGSIIAGEERQGKIIGINRKVWLAAAVVIGLLGLGGLWWYGQQERQEPKIALHPKGRDSTNTNNKSVDKQENLTTKKSESPHIVNPKTNNELANTTKKSKNETLERVNPSRPQTIVVQRNAMESTERQQLMKSYFVPDSLPVQIPDALVTTSAYYQEQRHEEAIAGFKKIVAKNLIDSTDRNNPAENPDIISRGEQRQKAIITFYAHYYLAQSYLSTGQTKEAIKELETIIENSPTLYWKSKVEWYLALAYIKAGQVPKAQALLQEVQQDDPSGEYQQKAIELSGKLKKE